MQLSRELLNVLPKNPDNTRKNDYEKIRQNVPLRGLEGVPGLPGAPQDEAGLTRICLPA